jgi:uncharacterized protein (DUF1697 family)
VPRHVALLRAINVGGHVVKMDRLRALLEGMKLAKVETFIASGNVLFDSTAKADALEQRIERELERELGYEVATFLRTPSEMAAAAAARPFPDLGDTDALYVGFLRGTAGADVRTRLKALATEFDDFELVGREMYWRMRGKLTDSKLTGAKLERVLAGPMTMRNVTTVRKLAEKLAG